MTKKGKKKKQQTQKEAASTSAASTSAASSSEQASSQQQEQGSSHRQLPQRAFSQEQQQEKKQTQVSDVHQQHLQPQQVPLPQAWAPCQQKPSSQQVTQQQTQSIRQQSPSQQQVSPHQQQTASQQQAWGLRQPQPQSQQARGPRQPQPQSQQARGPPQPQPQPQHARGPRQPQQAWGPPQPQQARSPLQPQQAWGPPQPQHQPQQARGPRQPQPQSQPQQARGPRQPQPQSQQQVSQQQAWGPRQPRPPLQQQVSPQQAWGPHQQQPSMHHATLSSTSGTQQQTVGQMQDKSGGIKESDTPSTSAASSSILQLPTTFSQCTMSGTSRPSHTMKKSELKQYQLTIPQRPNLLKVGTVGTPIRVLTNMFEIKFHPNFVTNAVHYDIDISPVASKSIYRQVFEKCRSYHFSNRFPAFDGKKNAYSANNLPFDDHMTADVQIYDEERGRDRDFKITFTKVADVDLSWIKNLKPGLDEANRDQTGIQVLDIIMRHAPASRLLPLGRSFFSSETRPQPLGHGVSLYVGSFSSAVLGWKPYINIDVSHKGFATPQPVIELMKELCNNVINLEVIKRNEKKIEKFLTGLKVDYEVPNQPNSKRTYRINGLGPSASTEQFEFDGSKGTIEEYFKRKKNYKLQWSALPCLWVGSRTKEQKIYLPTELCKIADGQPIKKLDEFQTSSMIRFAATDTFRRKDKISNAFSMINVNHSNTMRNEFRLSIDGNMKEVEARILPAPEIQYSQATATVNKGVWRVGKFNQAMQLMDGTWTILNLSPNLRDCELHTFKDTLKKYASNVGMAIGNPLTPFRNLRSPEQDIREILSYFEEKKNLKLIIVVLPDRTDRAYSKVKQVTELKVGVLTQCIKTMTLTKKCNEQTIKNILLKINSKLNGVNHTFTRTGMPFCLRNADCMLVGGDVSHPPPDTKNMPSIAAVAASHDVAAFQYNVEVRLQEPKKEMIVEFEEMILKQIMTYNSQTKKLPTRIIFYRDGVSEGQLAQVMHYEVDAIKRACIRIARQRPTFKPEITCLVVQKRHHVRLFPTRKEDTDDRNYNVKAGTIVDKEITHPNHIDFYLVSHASVQGTAKPTKYRCIYNESNFNEDQIEQLTYYLCHMFARCTRSVSYPAPTYYAHLGAFRGRAWIQEVPINVGNLAEEQRIKLDVKMARAPMCFV